ncbi:hypothetical protein RCL1_003401 [Eukaryota sp. TZLM3-RCL]
MIRHKPSHLKFRILSSLTVSVIFRFVIDLILSAVAFDFQLSWHSSFAFATSFLFPTSVYLLCVFSALFVHRLFKLSFSGFYIFFYILTAAYVFLPLINFMMIAFGNMRLTPATIFLFVSDLESLRLSLTDAWEYLANTSLGVAFMSLSFVALLIGFYSLLFIKSSSTNISYPSVGTFSLLISLFLLTSIFLPLDRHWVPPEASFFRVEKLTPLSNDTISLLRNFIPLPSNRYWLDDEFPLVHGSLKDLCKLYPTDNRCTEEGLNEEQVEREAYEEIERPDIYLVSWESLSGNYVSFADSPQSNSTTPNLERLFNEFGVFYPECVSATTPTAKSLFSSAFQLFGFHKTTFVEAANIPMDSIFSLIKRASPLYSLGYISATDPFYDKQTLLKDKTPEPFDDWYFHYENEGSYDEDYYRKTDRMRFALWNNDRILAQQLEQRLHLSFSQDSPLFYLIVSISSHFEFTTLDTPFRNDTDVLPSDNKVNYIDSLKYADQYLMGNIIDTIRSRKRANNTVVIVVGDHASYSRNLGNDCSECPPSPFEGDQVFHTSATLLYFGSDEQRQALGIPPAGTRDHRPITTVDVIATIADLAGARYEVSHSVGRSLLDKTMNDEHRKALSLSDNFAELSTPTAMFRTNWLGTRSVKMDRFHPTYTDSSKVSIDFSKVELIQDVAEAWHNLVFLGKLWHPKFIGREPVIVKRDVLSIGVPFGIVAVSALFFVSLIVSLSSLVVKLGKCMKNAEEPDIELDTLGHVVPV